MNNKILFADLDRTLLCDDKSISEKNRAAIQKMLERGHYFVLATGRPVESGRIVVKDLGLTSPGCYMIAFNGAVIYDCAADRVLYKSALPIEVAQEIFDRAHKAGIYAQTYNTVDIVTKRHTKELDYYVERSHMTYKLTRRISDCLDSEPQKVILIHLEDDEKLKRFQKANAAWAKGKCNSFFSCKEYLEYCLQEIRRICAELKIELNEKKTRIVKLSHGFTFLKTQIYLTDTGKILRKPCRKAVVRQRRKLVRQYRKLLAGELSFEDIRCSYASWRGCMEKKQARRTIHSMNRLFDRLFIENWQREEVPLYG